MAFRKYFFVFFAAFAFLLCQSEAQAAPAQKTRHAQVVKHNAAAPAHAHVKKGSVRTEKSAPAAKKGGLKKDGKAALAKNTPSRAKKSAAAADNSRGKERKSLARHAGIMGRHAHSYRYPRHTMHAAALRNSSARHAKKQYPAYTGLLPSVKRPPTVYRANLCPTVVSLGMDITDIASTQIGLPYRSGGTSPKTGFDCSGFVQWVFAKQGVKVPRSTHELRGVGREVAKSSLLPGDILIFRSPRASSGLHTGIYVGNNKFIHSPHTGSSIHIEDLDNSFYRRNYLTARRILKAPPCDARGYAELDFLSSSPM